MYSLYLFGDRLAGRPTVELSSKDKRYDGAERQHFLSTSSEKPLSTN